MKYLWKINNLQKVLNTEFQLLCKWREQIEIEMEIDDDDEENDLINMDVIDQSLLFTTVLVDLHNQGFKFDFNEQLLSSIITHYNHLKISWLKMTLLLIYQSFRNNQ